MNEWWKPKGLLDAQGRRRKVTYFHWTEIAAFHKKPLNNCWTCGHKEENYKKLPRDHIQSLSLGGKDELPNLRLLCKKCHDTKTLTEKFPKIKHLKKLEEKKKELWEYV